MATTRVIHGPRWPGRILAIAFVVVGVVAMLTDPNGVSDGIGILILLAVMAALVELATERPGLYLSDEYLTHKPTMGRTKRYEWNQIHEFSLASMYVMRVGNVPVVQMTVAHGKKPIKLTSAAGTRGPAGQERVQRLLRDLNGELHRKHPRP